MSVAPMDSNHKTYDNAGCEESVDDVDEEMSFTADTAEQPLVDSPENELAALDRKKLKVKLGQRNKATALGGTLINSSLFVSNVQQVSKRKLINSLIYKIIFQLKTQMVKQETSSENIDMVNATISLLTTSIILQIFIGILTILDVVGLHVVGGSHTSKDPRKRRRGKIVMMLLMVFSFAISVINYFIAAFLD